MLINVDLKTCSKYIHANEITLTKENNVLNTDELSEKGKRLFIEFFKNSFYATIPTVDYQAYIEEAGSTPEPEEPEIPPTDPEDPETPPEEPEVPPDEPEPPVEPEEPEPEVPVTYSIFRDGNTLTTTFSDSVKLNGVNLEDYAGTGIDFIKDTATSKKELELLDDALNSELISIITTDKEAVLTLEDNFFNLAIFDMLDSPEVDDIDLWPGNGDGIYKAKFIINGEAYTTLTDQPVTTVDDTEVTITVTKETLEEVTVTKGSFSAE